MEEEIKLHDENGNNQIAWGFCSQQRSRVGFRQKQVVNLVVSWKLL